MVLSVLKTKIDMLTIDKSQHEHGVGRTSLDCVVGTHTLNSEGYPNHLR